MRYLSFLPLIALVLLWTAGCGTPTVREVKISLTEFSFTPAQIEAKSGEHLRLVLTNAGKLSHRFVSEDMKASRDVAAGITEIVDVVAPGAKGIYAFTCDVPGHEQAGMRGQLEVK